MQEDFKEIPENFGGRLKRFRKSKGLSQDQLGRNVGVSAQTISDFERGVAKNPPSVDVLRRMGGELGVSPEHLLFGPRPPDFPEKADSSRSRVEEAPASYGRHPMVYPNYEAPEKEPTEEECRKYFDSYLQRAQQVPGGIGHAWVQLQLHFPLSQLDNLKKKK